MSFSLQLSALLKKTLQILYGSSSQGAAEVPLGYQYIQVLLSPDDLSMPTVSSPPVGGGYVSLSLNGSASAGAAGAAGDDDWVSLESLGLMPDLFPSAQQPQSLFHALANMRAETLTPNEALVLAYRLKQLMELYTAISEILSSPENQLTLEEEKALTYLHFDISRVMGKAEGLKHSVRILLPPHVLVSETLGKIPGCSVPAFGRSLSAQRGHQKKLRELNNRVSDTRLAAYGGITNPDQKRVITAAVQSDVSNRGVGEPDFGVWLRRLLEAASGFPEGDVRRTWVTQENFWQLMNVLRYLCAGLSARDRAQCLVGAGVFWSDIPTATRELSSANVYALFQSFINRRSIPNFLRTYTDQVYFAVAMSSMVNPDANKICLNLPREDWLSLLRHTGNPQDTNLADPVDVSVLQKNLKQASEQTDTLMLKWLSIFRRALGRLRDGERSEFGDSVRALNGSFFDFTYAQEGFIALRRQLHAQNQRTTGGPVSLLPFRTSNGMLQTIFSVMQALNSKIIDALVSPVGLVDEDSCRHMLSAWKLLGTVFYHHHTPNTNVLSSYDALMRELTPYWHRRQGPRYGVYVSIMWGLPVLGVLSCFYFLGAFSSPSSVDNHERVFTGEQRFQTVIFQLCKAAEQLAFPETLDCEGMLNTLKPALRMLFSSQTQASPQTVLMFLVAVFGAIIFYLLYRDMPSSVPRVSLRQGVLQLSDAQRSYLMRFLGMGAIVFEERVLYGNEEYNTQVGAEEHLQTGTIREFEPHDSDAEHAVETSSFRRIITSTASTDDGLPGSAGPEDGLATDPQATLPTMSLPLPSPAPTRPPRRLVPQASVAQMLQGLGFLPPLNGLPQDRRTSSAVFESVMGDR